MNCCIRDISCSVHAVILVVLPILFKTFYSTRSFFLPSTSSLFIFLLLACDWVMTIMIMLCSTSIDGFNDLARWIRSESFVYSTNWNCVKISLAVSRSRSPSPATMLWVKLRMIKYILHKTSTTTEQRTISRLDNLKIIHESKSKSCSKCNWMKSLLVNVISCK